MKNKILVTGGCGYIGSHTLVDLIENGFEVISVDSGINSDFSALKGIKQITGTTVKNYPFDLCDPDKIKEIFHQNVGIRAIIHFAALKSVSESVEKPILYFRNNLNSLINILECAKIYGVEYFIYSSSCTVYGIAEKLPVTEETPEKEAESPYGRTKQMGEKIITDSLAFTGLKCISLRYFNPAGAHPSALIGESPLNPALSLIPIITETAIGKRESMTVCGKDYDTRDGSCIRDYIHIMDLAQAHTKALNYLTHSQNETNYEVFNLGIGEGVTVLEAINAFEDVAGQKLNYKIGPRRSGDVPAIYADYSQARNKLGWTPKFNIKDIMHTAWEWEKKRSDLTFNPQ